jgi:malate/lactate dehydrogenase
MKGENKMYFYKLNGNTLFSLHNHEGLSAITEQEASRDNDVIYFLKKLDPQKSRRSFALTHPSLIYTDLEGLNLLCLNTNKSYDLPQWLLEKIQLSQVIAINTSYTDWQQVLTQRYPSKWRINIVGIGDVGSTLLMGLRLLGEENIKEIGIYDRDINKLKRWEFEVNQINNIGVNLPPVKILKEEEVFDCDLFAFCVTARVPAIGEENVDVRMVQLEENSKIINIYGKMAREAKYRGIFAVVSDPVDLLCKSVYISSNQDSSGNFNYKGLYPEQVRGYGLGVMNARAMYYANKSDTTKHFLNEGRVFGPHGADLVVANSIKNYNEKLSMDLTEKTCTANLELRKIGFKPYIAPALSSGALSLIATITGQWHYSATYMGGVYMGSKNRLTSLGTELEMLELPDPLFARLEKTYNKLREML